MSPRAAHLRRVFWATPKISAASAVYTKSDNVVMTSPLGYRAVDKPSKACEPATAATLAGRGRDLEVC